MNRKSAKTDKIINYCTGTKQGVKPQQLVNIFVLMDGERNELWRREIHYPNPYSFKYPPLVLASMNERTFYALLKFTANSGCSENEIEVTEKNYNNAGVPVNEYTFKR